MKSCALLLSTVVLSLGITVVATGQEGGGGDMGARHSKAQKAIEDEEKEFKKLSTEATDLELDAIDAAAKNSPNAAALDQKAKDARSKADDEWQKIKGKIDAASHAVLAKNPGDAKERIKKRIAQEKAEAEKHLQAATQIVQAAAAKKTSPDPQALSNEVRQARDILEQVKGKEEIEALY